MLGGYQILDLRKIDLTITKTQSNITNAYVLSQLLKLRDFIDKDYDFSKPIENQLKPVLIRYRDKKAGEKSEGAMFGELAVVDNYYTFKITGRISGALILTIKVAFEEITNAYGAKEWVIDTAKIQLQDVLEDLEGNLALEGDLDVSGDLDVGGDIDLTGDIDIGGDIDAVGKIEGGEIVEKMTGYSFSTEPKENIDITPIYAGVVKNGNKITYVLFCTYERTGTVDGGWCYNGFMITPQSIMDKLYPYEIGSTSVLANFNLELWEDIDAEPKLLKCAAYKQSGMIAFASSGLNSLDANTLYYGRIEVTFLLSDNLVPQE